MLSEREVEEKLKELRTEYEQTGSNEYKGNVEALEWVLEERYDLD